MDRRGQGISINVIVIAAIALLVLVILSVLVLRAGGFTSQGTKCEATGGVCKIMADDGTTLNPCGKESGETYDRSSACDKKFDETAYCCRTI